MLNGYNRIKILNDREIDNLYSLPKFTVADQITFFTVSMMVEAFQVEASAIIETVNS